MTHDPRYDTPRDDLPAYALGGLTPDEARAVERHLRDCEPCREELARYTLIPHALNLASPDDALPEGSKERLMRRVAPEPVSRNADPESPSEGTDAPRRRSNVAPWMLAAASLILISLLSVGLVQQSRQAAERQATIDSVVDLMERADLEVKDPPTPGSPTRLRVYEAREGDVGMVVLDKLPRPPEGKEYQLWMGRGDKLKDEGAFMPTDLEKGSYHKLLKPPEGFARYSYVGVAMVPKGGEPEPPPESDSDWVVQSEL